MAKKAVPILLMIVGTAILLGVGLFALDNATSKKPEGLGTWISTILGLLLGASAGLKGWVDWNKKASPSHMTRNIALDKGQIATGEEGRNIQTGDSSNYIEQNIQNYYEVSKADFPIHRPGSAPPLPSLVVGREVDIRILKERLIGPANKPHSTKIQVLTAIKGWPGVGKTTIATMLAYDQDIMEKYSDGTLWVSLGTDPNILSSLASWGRALGIDDLIKEKTVQDASSRLSAILRSKRMLLIIDDVWEEAHAVPFKVGGTGCITLITTRSENVARALAATSDDIFRLNVLTEKKSLELLKEIAPTIVKKYFKACRELVQELEGLPLALQVAGRLLNAEKNYNFSVLDLLQDLRSGKKILESKAPADRTDLANETTPTVTALFQRSTDRLNQQTRDCFAYLGAFAPKPATFDLLAMKTVWDMEDPRPVVRTLVDRGLLEFIPEIGRYQMHALLVAHAKSLLED